MAGKTSMLKKMFQGDPDQLKIAPDQSVRVVPVHGIDDNEERIVHVLNAYYQGQWVELPCGQADHNSCPFCEDPRDELRITTVKSVMIVWNLDTKKMQFIVLPKSMAKVLVQWELAARKPIKGREVIMQRTGSGFKNTRYSASIMEATEELPPWDNVKDEFERVHARVLDMMKTPPLEELRRIYQLGNIRFRNTAPAQQRTSVQDAEPDTLDGGAGWGSGGRRTSVVEEDDW